jgi:hypothetical protein
MHTQLAIDMQTRKTAFRFQSESHAWSDPKGRGDPLVRDLSIQ